MGRFLPIADLTSDWPLPGEKRPPTGTEKAFPVVRYEIGPVFPGGQVGLAIQTAVFGSQGFVMNLDTAKRLAADLRACAERIQQDQSTPGRMH